MASYECTWRKERSKQSEYAWRKRKEINGIKYTYGGQIYGNHRFKSVQMQALLQMYP